MIGEVIRLTLAEWYKLRRRWLLWILLAVSILISQAFVWGLNTAYHVNEETFGALIPSYEYRSEDGIIELTCADVAQGRVEEKLAPLSEAELGQIAESLQEWQSTCVGYTTPEETRQAFTLPYAITATSEGQLFPIVFSLILGAAVVGAGVRIWNAALHPDPRRGAIAISGRQANNRAAGRGGVGPCIQPDHGDGNPSHGRCAAG